MIFYINDYRKAKASKLNAAAQFDFEQEERLCVNWNPAVRTLALSCYQRPQELSPHLPGDLAIIDVDQFLDRVYGLATQI